MNHICTQWRRKAEILTLQINIAALTETFPKTDMQTSGGPRLHNQRGTEEQLNRAERRHAGRHTDAEMVQEKVSG